MLAQGAILIYRSNLTAPDLQPAFKHVHCRPMGHSMGHDVLSDFADRPVGDPLLGLYKNCGFWTHDEAAILFNIASQVNGTWLDIGAHTGWTGAHERAARCHVLAVDNMFAVPEFYERFRENVGDEMRAFVGTSNEFFEYCDREKSEGPFNGIVIDGDHCSPCPLQDAKNAEIFLWDDGVILFHDFIGRPVREGVEYLMSRGFKCKVYWTPHMVACCWRGDLQPPDHVRDPRIDWEGVKRSMSDFDFGACA
jgi:hypothetical protein